MKAGSFSNMYTLLEKLKLGGIVVDVIQVSFCEDTVVITDPSSSVDCVVIVVLLLSGD